jgi:tetratricopeptide (TPR) repeat protein
VPRTKMTRHELKEQDEITTSLQKFTEFVVRYKKELTMGVSIAAGLAIITFGWTYYRSTRNARAEAELSQAIDAFNDTTNIKSEKERYEKTLAAAQKTYDQYRSLPIGNMALYYIGLSQDGLGDTAKSVQSLQQVADSGDPSVKSVAQFALGSIYKKHGENQKAIDIYKRLYDTGGYSKAAVAYELALVYEANNQPDQAKDYYQKVVSEFPDSPFRTNADDALKRLGVPATPPAPAQKPS